MEEFFSFGEWLRDRRKKIGLTQAELADRVGCSVSAVRKFESELRRPSRQIARLIASALEIPDGKTDLFVKIARGEKRVDSSFLTSQTEQMLPAVAGTTGGRPETGIPILSTPLIGRGPELSQLLRLLRSEECHLISVIGPGGIGKTRFAIEAAHAVQDEFADGAVFVPLDSVHSPGMVASAIGEALGLSFHGASRSEDRLLSELINRETLLVLDNMEHLISSASVIATILQRAERVKILVTSHARLNVHGEWSFEITGLPVPPAEKQEGISDYSSVRLFFEVAKRSDRDYQFKLEDAKWINQICQLTEGNPLAIELAASWVRLLSCEEIANEIAQSLDFLASDTADFPLRHRSIRAVFDHSWGLLTPEEQSIFAKLSIFQGGFRREAAEHVASARLATLSRLVDRSLLRRTETSRYEVHDILRIYALEKLKQDPDNFLDTRTRHSRFYSAWLASLDETLRSEEQITALEYISKDIDNVRLAWNWTIAHSMYAEIRQAIPSLSWFFELRGWYQEGAETFQRAVDLFCVGRPGGCQSSDENAEKEHSMTYGRLLVHNARFLFCRGQLHEAFQEYQRADDVLEKVFDSVGQADVKRGMAETHLKMENFEQAMSACNESLEIGQKVEYDWNLKHCHLLAGIIQFSIAEYDLAREDIERSLAFEERVVDLRSSALAHAYLGRIDAIQKDLNAANEHLDESWRLGRKTEDPFIRGLIQEFLGLTAIEAGQIHQAKEWLQESRRAYLIAHDEQALRRNEKYMGFTEHPAASSLA